MPEDFTYKAQDVSYLGFLENQLRDLQGIATLAYELIQNADDVKDADGRPGSSWISFDVRDDALVIANDGVFRPLDFERLQTIAGGGKRVEAGTIGAFGLGFLAVYQVTDAPEIFSGDRHWIIHPEAEPGERIQERSVEISGTRLRLPWAFDPQSPVRQALRLPAVNGDTLDKLARTIGQALELGALFLRQLQHLEVRRQGEVVRRIERSAGEMVGAGRQLHLADESGQTATWLLFETDFAEEAAVLRGRHPQIETQRASRVQLALPLSELNRQGRLFAGLPTDSTSPLPFHINADFFPTSDRKRIHFDGGYQAEWNKAGLQAAAALLGAGFETVRQQLRPTAFWQLLQQLAYTRDLARQGELPAVFTTFWQALSPLFATTPILYTVQGEWILPGAGRVPAQVPTAELASILSGLGLPLPHPELVPFYELMRDQEVGVRPLTLADLVDAVARAGLTRVTPLFEAPPFLAGVEEWQALWRFFDRLTEPYAQPSVRVRERQLLNQVALVLTEDMTLDRPDRVFRGNAEVRALFPDVPWVHPQLSERDFPGRLVADFGVRQAVERLAHLPVDQLEEEWRMGRLDLPRLFRWFESQQIEIFADDPALQKEIRRLPLVPVAGELRPLAELYIPGGFEDPVGLAGVVPLEALGGRRQFLQDLGVEALSFDAYVQRELPRVLAQQPDLASDARHRLLRLLAERLGELRDDELLQEQLSRLPLIPCLDGSFRPAREVYATRAARTLLGDKIHVAEPVDSQARVSLYRWLGVRSEPSPLDLVQRLLQLGKQAAAGAGLAEAETIAVAEQCWLRLQGYFEQGELAPKTLVPLEENSVIPVGKRLAPPERLFFADTTELVAHFAGLEPHLVDPAHAAAPVWALAGVRSLSAAVRRELVAPSGSERVPALRKRIATRLPLIRRIIRAEVDAKTDSHFLDTLDVVAADPLQVRYRLALGDEDRESTPEPVSALLVPEQERLYVAGGEDSPPWLVIAREFARALTGGQPAGGVLLALKEVLAADSILAASRLLDELGYPE